MVRLSATFTSTQPGVTPLTYRWDFGDGSPFTAAGPSAVVTHTYPACAVYPARVEIVDSLGNHALARTDAVACVPTYLPAMFKPAASNATAARSLAAAALSFTLLTLLLRQPARRPKPHNRGRKR